METDRICPRTVVLVLESLQRPILAMARKPAALKTPKCSRRRRKPLWQRSLSLSRKTSPMRAPRPMDSVWRWPSWKLYHQYHR